MPTFKRVFSSHLMDVQILALFAGLASGCTATASVSAGGQSRCSLNSAVSCSGGADGYTCTGAALPSDTDASLDCSNGVADGADTDFCCLTFTATTTCARDATVSSCAPGSYGFSCTGSDTPDQADASLVCSGGVPGNAGSTLFCCSLGGTTTPSCAQDPAVTGCLAGSMGYSCVGSDTPEQSDGSLVCSTGTPGNGNTEYCCVPWTSSACAQDSSVQGCQYPSVGFSCTGSTAPSQVDASLTCSSGTPGNNGETLFCCQ